MVGMERFSAGLWAFGPCIDRFCTAGYRESVSVEARLKQASRVVGLEGVEVVYPSDFGSRLSVDVLKGLLDSYRLKASMVCVDVYSEPRWMYGSFTSVDEGLRREAVKIVKGAMDSARELEAMQVNLWLGQDGYDYPFQSDHRLALDRVIEGLRDCAEHRPDVRLCIEYKLKEPRTHILIGTASKALLIANELGLKNVGVTLDVGHALMAYENLAESAVMLSKWGKLFHIHFNDNYREWDHDLIAGSIHLWEYLELLLWLQVVSYEGWYSLDIYPYRENPIQACEQSIRAIKGMVKLVKKLDIKEISQKIREGRVMDIQRALQDIILPK